MTHSTRAPLLLLAFAACHLSSQPALAQSTRSPIDLLREDAAAVFGSRLAALSMMNAQAAADQHRYEIACKNKKTTTLPLYPSFPGKLEAKNETTPTCRILREDVRTRSALVADELSRIDEDARRRGTLPGIMRDLKVASGLDVVTASGRP